MSFSIVQTGAKAGDKHGEIFKLGTRNARIEVWPFIGFNCLRWQVLHAGEWQDRLYVAPDWESNPVATRSGHPILFPFPNRLRGGRFTFESREYQTPLTDNSGLHANHGFTPRNPWGRVDASIEADHVWVSGEFLLSRDLPACCECWPADARLRVTYRLFENRLRVEATVDAADGKPLPFGLGYHPYFTLGGDCNGWSLQTGARSIWEMEGSCPSGGKLPIPAKLDFSRERAIDAAALDTAYGDHAPGAALATLTGESGKLTVTADRAFRELLLFTPVHRKAFAIEPYTCTADAANLQGRGVDAGWRVLAAGESFAAAVDYQFEATR